MSSAIVICWSW